MQRQLGKSFEPQTFEKELYAFWEKEGCFAASDVNAPGQEAFSIMIPPPNVTGVLHMGHALTNAIQDILTRWRRMSGDNALWLPGTDHAGIATQNQVEKQIAKEGKGPSGRPLTRHDLGREKFLERTWQWKEESHKGITAQLRRLGSSLDWSRERFTMDEGLSAAVREVFVRLFEEGLIYQGERIINWCPRCQTALSDLEVIPTDRKGNFWHIVYPIVEKDGTPVKGPDGQPTQLTIATTRPETLLGDSAVAVHPEDERYAHIHGKFAKLPLLGRIIPVITDTYVDKEFGTGALKVTPAHDFNDADLGKKHNLAIIQVMGKDGFLTDQAGPYQGLKYLGPKGQNTSEARDKVVEELKAAGQLAKVEDHAQRVGLCERCDTVAEPLVSMQWWVKIAPLAKPAIEAVETGKIQFSPKTWEKTYFEWMYNIKDWCISRQLWWGHQIPAWHCQKCKHVHVARSAPTQCAKCGSKELKQDEDVLDTWFSSALWPFSTLGWPEKTPALKTFYPTSILETGFDIIFFWVARMIMMGIHIMGDVPFRKVYLHAMVRDEKGQKMSKSKGNVIDPLTLIDQHGADPLRFTLAAMAGQGRDIKLSVDRVEGYRAFANKLWNAVKFFHLQFEADNGGPVNEPVGGAEKWLVEHHADLLPQNQWILSRVQRVNEVVTKGFENFELNESAQALYEFTWHEFCDWFIEFSKLPLKDREEKGHHGETIRAETLFTLYVALEKTLRLLHPIMPFVTEALWQSFGWVKPGNTPARERDGKPAVRTISLQKFPEPNRSLIHSDSEHTVAGLKTLIEAVRNFRGENSVAPKVKLKLQVVAGTSAAKVFVETFQEDFKAMSQLESIQFMTKEVAATAGRGAEAVIPITQPPLELRIALKGLVNVEEESKRIQKEIERVKADLEFVRNKLSKESFMAKAPPALVTAEREKEAGFVAKLGDLEGALKRLASLA